MAVGETLVEAALRVLNTPDPVEKAKLGDQIANNWLQGVISNPYHPSQPDFIVPQDSPMLASHTVEVSVSWWLVLCRSSGKTEAYRADRPLCTALFTLKVGPLICIGQEDWMCWPTTISHFCNGGDNETAFLKKRIYPEKALIVLLQSSGSNICSRSTATSCGHVKYEVESEEVIQKFHEVVRAYFRVELKPPFNEAARKVAGFCPRWYEPLAVKDFTQ